MIALENHTEIITSFAEDKKIYNANLKSGFVKMCDFGNDATQFTDISDFLLDDPNNQLRYMTHAT